MNEVSKMFEIKKRIGASMVGPDYSVKDSAIIDMLQECCVLQLDNCEVTQKYYEMCNATTFLSYWQIDYLKQPEYGSSVTVGTSVFEMKRSYGTRNCIIKDEEGNPLIMVASGGANVDKTTGKPAPMPKDILSVYPLYDKIDMEYAPRKVHIPEDVDAERFEPWPVRKYQIDYNNHVNNARYMDVAEDYIPDGFEKGRLIIAYVKPAKLGDVFYPVRYIKDNKVWIILEDENGESYVKMEYTARG